MKHYITLAALILNITAMAQTSQLNSVYQSNTVWNGVTTTDDGRVFVCFPLIEGGDGMRIAEMKSDGTAVPYPDAAWNNWKKGDDVTHKIVRANSVRVSPDGNLWIVDTGQPKMGDNYLPGGSKLIEVDLHTNKVIRTISLDEVLKPKSMADDLRIYDNHIYITDAGEPGLIILDLATGKGRRVLEKDPSTTDALPMIAEGKIMYQQDGSQVKINADQLEVSPDGKYLYFQAASGLMYRVELKYLNKVALTKSQLSAHVHKWFDTPSTGGTAIDKAGNIYVSDINHSRIFRISPEGKSETIVEDKRLIWCDALWIDNKGFLWMPVGQLHRLAAFQKGKSKVSFPVHIYKMQIHAEPFRS
jgi:sugar lactone lactonase YvrE